MALFPALSPPAHTCSRLGEFVDGLVVDGGLCRVGPPGTGRWTAQRTNSIS